MKILSILLTLILLVVPSAPAWATAAPASGYPSNTGRTNAEMQQYFEDTLAVLKELPGGAARTAQTIASGSFALPNNATVAVVTSESGTADDLTNVTQSSARDGRFMFLTAASGHTITIKNAAGGSGQFLMSDSADLVLQSTQYHVFYYNSGSTRWEEIQRGLAPTALGGLARTTLTLDTNGYATPTRAVHLIDTFAAAASDNCDRLVTTNKVPFVLVRPANAARVVTLRHNQGGDGTLNNLYGDNITFSSALQAVLYERNGTAYDEVARFGFATQPAESKSGTFTAEWDRTYVCSGTSSYTVNIPTAVGNSGRKIRLYKTSTASYVLTVDPASTQTSNGLSTEGIKDQWSLTEIESDGTNVLRTTMLGQYFGGVPNTILTVQDGYIQYQGGSGGGGSLMGWDGSNNVIVYPVETIYGYTASSEQTVSTSAQTSVAHGLGRMPYNYYAVLRCKTTDNGYSVGDEVQVYLSDSSTNEGYCVWANSTNIGVSTSTAIQVVPKAGGNCANITPGNWRWVFYYK